MPHAGFIRPMRIAIFLGSSMLLIHAAQAGSGPTNASIRGFLQGYLQSGGHSDNTARYSVANVSLNNNKKAFVIYITGDAWCGSGGCTAMIVKPEGQSFKVINKITLARLPIQILPTKTRGWYDLAMPVGGGGSTSHRFALLKFNGKKYPSNPSTATLVKPTGLAAGRSLPLKEPGELVY